MINRIPPNVHTVESRVTAPPYDHLKDNDSTKPGEQFKSWIEQNSEKFFNRFAAYTYSTMKQLEARQPGQAIDTGDFLASIEPEKRRLSAPYPVAKLEEAMRSLGKELSENPNDNTSADAFLRGTTNLFPNVKFTNARKIYLNPPLEHVGDFVRAFYRNIDALKVPIHGSKVHTEGMEKDTKGENVISQGHNTFVVYVADDRSMPYLLQAIGNTERELGTGVHLYSYEKTDVTKTPTLLGGKVILGGSDVKVAGDQFERSFDQWTNAVAFAALQAFRANPNISEIDVLNAMKSELQKRTVKTPNEYLLPRLP